MADIARLTRLIEPETQALGFELVRVKLTGSGEERALQVMAEDPATGQLLVGQCAELSRRISDAIDAAEEAGEELIEGTYNLEVSSPGIDRPLTREKDYANWAGHEANISLAEAIEVPGGPLKKLRGTLIGIENGIVAIEDKREGRIDVPFAQIHAARLVLTDALIAATKPLDTSGIDEIIEFNEEEKADN